MRVLISIKPEFVKKIFSGEKKFEYRKAIFRNQNVDTVIIYATKPCGKVVGEFKLNRVLCDNPEKIWKNTQEFSGISKEFFDQYFKNKEKAYAIEIEDVIQYKYPLSLNELDKDIKTPPQSFQYLKRKWYTMRFKKLEITEPLELVIDFDASPANKADFFMEDKELRAKNLNEVDFTKFKERQKDTIFYDIFQMFLITDKRIIEYVLKEFIDVCDPHMSPQELFEANGVPYSSLILDYDSFINIEGVNKQISSDPGLCASHFDPVIKELYNIIGAKFDAKYLKYICAITVSYPKTWNIEIEE